MATAAERRAERARLRRETIAIETAQVNGATEDKPASRSTSRDTVTVCCKVPNGLILQNHVLVDGFEPVFGGGTRPVKKAIKDGPAIHIRGSSRPTGEDPDARRVIGGYGLTFNVPKEPFERWMRDNEQSDLVQNKLIFAAGSKDDAQAQARDQKSIRSGLEPLNTEGRRSDGSYADPRMPRNIKKYKAEDESTDIRSA